MGGLFSKVEYEYDKNETTQDTANNENNNESSGNNQNNDTTTTSTTGGKGYDPNYENPYRSCPLDSQGNKAAIDIDLGDFTQVYPKDKKFNKETDMDSCDQHGFSYCGRFIGDVYLKAHPGGENDCNKYGIRYVDMPYIYLEDGNGNVDDQTVKNKMAQFGSKPGHLCWLYRNLYEKGNKVDDKYTNHKNLYQILLADALIKNKSGNNGEGLRTLHCDVFRVGDSSQYDTN